MIVTRRTIAATYRELFADERHYGSWSHGGYNKLSDSEYRHIAYNKAWDKVLPAYAWPGGYPMAYYPMGDYGLTGDVLCADCARRELQDDKTARLIPECQDSYEGNDSYDHLTCDQCYTVIAEAWDREEDTETAI